jgi:hypothetical protein
MRGLACASIPPQHQDSGVFHGDVPSFFNARRRSIWSIDVEMGRGGCSVALGVGLAWPETRATVPGAGAASGARCRAGSPRGAWRLLHRQLAGDRDLRRWPAGPRDLSRWLVRRRSRRRLMAGRTHALAGSHRTEGTPPGPHLASQPRRGQAATPARHRAIALRQLAGDRDSSPFRWRGKRRVEWRAWGRPSRRRGRGGKGERRNASGGP